MRCWGNICISERATSGKVPARVSIKSPAVGFASHRRTWETWSHKNLMKACLGYRSVKSVRWAVKKAPVQIEVIYDKCRVVVAISKSSFLPDEQKRRISRDYCKDERGSSIYWVGSLIRGQVNVL